MLIRKQTRFTAEFKRQVVKELLSIATGLARLSKKHNLLSSLLYQKKQYARGRFDNELAQEVTVLDRINKLEKMLSKLTQKM